MSRKSNVWKLHEEASRQGKSFYEDPDSGFMVFTEDGLKQRGRCCGSGCRHCPFAHENIPQLKKLELIQQPSWLTTMKPSALPADILFWSGGKDSYLALTELLEKGAENIVLLTTFDPEQGIVAHQEVAIAQIVKQASHLGLPLLGVPLHTGREYSDVMFHAVSMIQKPQHLVFGDLHLEHIRSWREETFRSIVKDLEVSLVFPLWKMEYKELMRKLETSGVRCEITAVTEAAQGGVSRGDCFDQSFIDRLPVGVDAFGENGEFHTLAKVWEIKQN